MSLDTMPVWWAAWDPTWVGAAEAVGYVLASGMPGHEPAQADALREVLSHPFGSRALDAGWLAWGDGTLGKLARAIYEERAFDQMPVLGDALEDAGCTDERILRHCREAQEHVRGCWLVDLLLGKG
jgi:hypothetical protein